MSSYSPSYSQSGAMPSHDLRRHDKKKPSNYAEFKVFLIRYERPIADELAERTGLEPATSGVTGQHSNQLNYRSALFRFYLNHPWWCRRSPSMAHRFRFTRTSTGRSQAFAKPPAELPLRIVSIFSANACVRVRRVACSGPHIVLASRRAMATTWRPHGDSNPGRHRERVVS